MAPSEPSSPHASPSRHQPSPFATQAEQSLASSPWFTEYDLLGMLNAEDVDCDTLGGLMDWPKEEEPQQGLSAGARPSNAPAVLKEGCRLSDVHQPEHLLQQKQQEALQAQEDAAMAEMPAAAKAAAQTVAEAMGMASNGPLTATHLSQLKRHSNQKGQFVGKRQRQWLKAAGKRYDMRSVEEYMPRTRLPNGKWRESMALFLWQNGENSWDSACFCTGEIGVEALLEAFDQLIALERQHMGLNDTASESVLGRMLP
ncbi:hypothetical protein FOA52_013070 [Chlamydomonas sp. UWO 241]|nr:hypothetical protein FOA52_013070 [Chlamydomonas sp. UWO 241]